MENNEAQVNNDDYNDDNFQGHAYGGRKRSKRGGVHTGGRRKSRKCGGNYNGGYGIVSKARGGRRKSRRCGGRRKSRRTRR